MELRVCQEKVFYKYIVPGYVCIIMHFLKGNRSGLKMTYVNYFNTAAYGNCGVVLPNMDILYKYGAKIVMNSIFYNFK